MSSITASGSAGRSGMLRPSSSEDWEPYREVIARLYEEAKLKDVIEEMERGYNFKATEKQYKTQIKKWCLDTKYTKGAEYLAMIGAKRRREKEEPPKETVFRLRGRVVDPKDIARFERRAIKRGLITADDDLSGQESIEDLAYGTPSPRSVW